MTAKTLLFAAGLIALGSAAAAAETCAETESRLRARAAELDVVADQESALRGVAADALAATATCTANERLWYLAARGAEVIDPGNGEDPLGAGADALTIAHNGLSHAESSAALETIIARLTGEIEPARQAIAIAPDYRPAHRALAVALAREGRSAEALAVLGDGQTTPDRMARARVFLALSRPADAIRESQAALAGPFKNPDEPTPISAFQEEINETLGLALIAAGKPGQAKASLKRAADLGSEAARKALAHLR